MAKKRKKKDKRNRQAMMRQKKAIQRQRKARRERTIQAAEGKSEEVDLPLTTPDESAERDVWGDFWDRFNDASWESKVAVCLETIRENKMSGQLAFDMLQRHASVAKYL